MWWQWWWCNYEGNSGAGDGGEPVMSDDSQRNGGIKWQEGITKHFQFLKRQKNANFR